MKIYLIIKSFVRSSYYIFLYFLKFDLKNGIKLTYLYLTTSAKKNDVLTINPTNLTHPFYLRKGTTDILIFNQVFIKRAYDVKVNFKPKIIFDLGANIGLVSIFYKSKFPNAIIVAIEPEKSNYFLLKKNLEKYKNITSINTAVWSSNSYLKIINQNERNWGFQVKLANKKDEKSFKALDIPSLLKIINKEQIDILKIDIEGSEHELFSKNYSSWLNATRLIIVEPHDLYIKGSTERILLAAEKNNYSVAYSGEHILLSKKSGFSI